MLRDYQERATAAVWDRWARVTGGLFGLMLAGWAIT